MHSPTFWRRLIQRSVRGLEGSCDCLWWPVQYGDWHQRGYSLTCGDEAMVYDVWSMMTARLWSYRVYSLFCVFLFEKCIQSCRHVSHREGVKFPLTISMENEAWHLLSEGSAVSQKAKTFSLTSLAGIWKRKRYLLESESSTALYFLAGWRREKLNAATILAGWSWRSLLYMKRSSSENAESYILSLAGFYKYRREAMQLNGCLLLLPAATC